MKFNVDLDQTKQSVKGQGNSSFEVLYSAAWVMMFVLNISGAVGIAICSVMFFFLPFDWSAWVSWLALFAIWLVITSITTWMIYLIFSMAFGLARQAANINQLRDNQGRFASAKVAPTVTGRNGHLLGYLINGRIVPPQNIDFDSDVIG